MNPRLRIPQVDSRAGPTARQDSIGGKADGRHSRHAQRRVLQALHQGQGRRLRVARARRIEERCFDPIALEAGVGGERPMQFVAQRGRQGHQGDGHGELGDNQDPAEPDGRSPQPATAREHLQRLHPGNPQGRRQGAERRTDQGERRQHQGRPEAETDHQVLAWGEQANRRG